MLWQSTIPKNVLTAPGTAAADGALIAAVSGKIIKVCAYSFYTTGTNLDLLKFRSGSAGGTELWRASIQALTSTVFGANLAVPSPQYLFKTVLGEGLYIDVDQSDTLHYSLTYWATDVE